MGTPSLIVIGGGAMAEAILLGAGRLETPICGGVVLCEPSADRRRALGEVEWGGAIGPVSVVESASVGLAQATEGDQLLLAVKPQALPDVAREIGAALAAEPRVVISILAGARRDTVRTSLGGAACVVRAMPNLGARYGRGMTALAKGAAAEDARLARALLGACGEVVDLDEDLMDAFTAIAGSGPAYAFLLAEAMVAAGVELGIDASTAERVARWTLAGAGETLVRSTDSPGALRARVTSKGGTTAAALDVLAERDVSQAFIDAMRAARDRGAELGREG